MTICEGTHSVAVGYESGQLHIYRIDYCMEKNFPAVKHTPIRQYEGFKSNVIGVENLGRNDPALLSYGLS